MKKRKNFAPKLAVVIKNSRQPLQGEWLHFKGIYCLLNHVPITELVHLCKSFLLPAWHTTKSCIYVIRTSFLLSCKQEPKCEMCPLPIQAEVFGFVYLCMYMCVGTCSCACIWNQPPMSFLRHCLSLF